jgi:hemoglobin
MSTPFEALGGEPGVRALTESFYDHMDGHEQAIAQLHVLDPDGSVSRESRDRFALFLVGWLGGPQTYSEVHGHPRLRLRHGRVPIDSGARDAWLRCMTAAMDQHDVRGEVRQLLDARFAEVAEMLRNRRG